MSDVEVNDLELISVIGFNGTYLNNVNLTLLHYLSCYCCT